MQFARATFGPLLLDELAASWRVRPLRYGLLALRFCVMPRGLLDA